MKDKVPSSDAGVRAAQLNRGASMKTDVRALADEVSDEVTFLRFVAALAADWQAECDIEAVDGSTPYAAGPLCWENGTIGEYLQLRRNGAKLL